MWSSTLDSSGPSTLEGRTGTCRSAARSNTVQGDSTHMGQRRRNPVNHALRLARERRSCARKYLRGFHHSHAAWEGFYRYPVDFPSWLVALARLLLMNKHKRAETFE